MSEAEREKLLDLVQTLELKLNSIEQVTQRFKTFQICFLPFFPFSLPKKFFKSKAAAKI